MANLLMDVLIITAIRQVLAGQMIDFCRSRPGPRLLGLFCETAEQAVQFLNLQFTISGLPTNL
jgi:hypothetical protein